MSTQPNGQHQAYRDPTRRLRFDELTSIMSHRISGSGPGRTAATAAMLPRGHSGRRFVLVAGLMLLVIWGVLYVIFRDWRARYRARAAYGTTQVVPAIDSLEAIVPANVNADEWRDAVRQTRAMLTTVTSSNLLDMKEMERLRTELDQFVARARAHPDTGPGELAAIWNEMAERAEFLFRDNRSADGVRHPRPRILPPRPEKPRVRPAATSR
ncbi:MAG: hypothetical protein ACHRXM_15785 [Isosphaerales bacterium]